MRPIGDALHQRIGEDESQRRDAEPDGEPVELQQDDKPDEQAARQEDDGPRAPIPVRWGSAARASARPWHRSRGRRCRCRCSRRRASRSRRWRRARMSQASAVTRRCPRTVAAPRREAPPAGKQQQPGADRPVEAHQPRIGPRRRRQPAVDPTAARDVRAEFSLGVGLTRIRHRLLCLPSVRQ